MANAVEKKTDGTYFDAPKSRKCLLERPPNKHPAIPSSFKAVHHNQKRRLALAGHVAWHNELAKILLFSTPNKVC